MREERIGDAELLDVWRDAASAAELAERLANEAAEAARVADANADAALDVARLANDVAESASRAAETARVAAGEAVAHRLTKHPDAAA